MAAASLQTTRDVPSRNQVFIPQETLDHPFDVTLVVEDGKELKGHRGVLSEASPFFEKMLNTDMRESSEGVVRLEMLSELSLRDILEFIYTGNVQISAEDNAQDLIAMADYLVLPHLKTLAENCLVKNLMLNDSNAISNYYFAEKYGCEDLMCTCKNFILTNFTTISKTEAFLNLSRREVKLWISSDEINVSAEEDVFTLILTWIDREKSERKKYFAELFCEVRLDCVLRDYLLSNIVTNELVNDNKGCMDLVKDVLKNMKLIDAKNRYRLRVKPRKSLETPIILFVVEDHEKRDQILACYNPREDAWSQFFGTLPRLPWSRFDGTLCRHVREDVICFHEELYSFRSPGDRLLCHDAFSDRWKSIPYIAQRAIRKICVRDEEEIYVLSVSVEGNLIQQWINLVNESRSCESCLEIPDSYLKHRYHLTKYKPESSSWEDITSFDMGSRVKISVVVKDNFVYFLGGLARRTNFLGYSLTDADRYDLTTDTWDKIADLHEPRFNADGAVAYGKIFVGEGTWEADLLKTYEVYDEGANEWQTIPKPCVSVFRPIWVCADSRLFAINRFIDSRLLESRIIECYDPDSNSWKQVTQIPIEMLSEVPRIGQRYTVSTCCSMRLFLKTRELLEQASLSQECSTRSQKGLLNIGEHKCTIT